MNRDEMRDRAPEVPPAAWTQAPILAPRDSHGGGTWCAMNHWGLAGALLNAYMPGDAAPAGGAARPSRGGILPVVLSWPDFQKATKWFQASFDPTPYASFTLVLASRESWAAWRWDGDSLSVVPLDTGSAMITSSSWNAGEVLPWRRRAFDAWLREGEAMEGSVPKFHLLSPAGQEAFAPLMSRERTATRSITQIEWGAETKTWLRHWPIWQGRREPGMQLLTFEIISE